MDNEKVKVEFPVRVYYNLFEFLKRTTLKGEEVVAYNEIIQCLSNPIKEENKNENKY